MRHLFLLLAICLTASSVHAGSFLAGSFASAQAALAPAMLSLRQSATRNASAAHPADAVAQRQLELLLKNPSPGLLLPDGATLGEPMGKRFVKSDQLAAFAAGQDPDALLLDFSQRVYPVLDAAEDVALIEIEFQDGAWTATKFENFHYAQRLGEERWTRAAASGIPAGSLLLVEIPDLGVRLIAEPKEVAGVLQTRLTPVYGSFWLPFEQGRTEDAAALLLRLAPFAKL